MSNIRTAPSHIQFEAYHQLQAGIGFDMGGSTNGRRIIPLSPMVLIGTSLIPPPRLGVIEVSSGARRGVGVVVCVDTVTTSGRKRFNNVCIYYIERVVDLVGVCSRPFKNEDITYLSLNLRIELTIGRQLQQITKQLLHP